MPAEPMPILGRAFLDAGYVERVGRGRYGLTDKGKALLALLS